MPDRDLLEPNAYDLRGGGTVVRYSTSGLPGGPTLTVDVAGRTTTFEADALRVEHDANLGTQVTGVLERVIDGPTVTFTLVLPAVALSVDASKVLLTTFGVIVTNLDSIAGPPAGVQQTYEIVRLSGTAAFVRGT